MSNIELTVEKMVCMGLKFIYRGMQKFSDALRPVQRKFLKPISTYCTKYNEINMYHSDIQKHVSFENGLNIMYFLCTDSHKNFPMHYNLWGENF